MFIKVAVPAQAVSVGVYHLSYCSREAAGRSYGPHHIHRDVVQFPTLDGKLAYDTNITITY